MFPLHLGFMWNSAQGIVDMSAARINVVNLSCIISRSSDCAMWRVWKSG